jgi:phospholipase C
MVSSLISSATLASVKAATSSTTITNTKTPIKHLVILFQENVSFDHYFGTYPFATNPPGEPRFITAHSLGQWINWWASKRQSKWQLLYKSIQVR